MTAPIQVRMEGRGFRSNWAGAGSGRAGQEGLLCALGPLRPPHGGPQWASRPLASPSAFEASPSSPKPPLATGPASTLSRTSPELAGVVGASLAPCGEFCLGPRPLLSCCTARPSLGFQGSRLQLSCPSHRTPILSC